MKINKKIILTTLAFLVLFGHFSYGQNITEEKIRAAYILNFIKNIEWPNEDTMSEFNVGVLGNDQKLIKELKALESQAIKGSAAVKIEQLRNASEATGLEVLYIPKEQTESMGAIIARLMEQHVLLISDQATDQRSVMINFIYANKRISFEINKANIINAALKVKPKLLLLGGTEIDVAELYKSSQDSLQKERLLVESQKKALNDQRAQIKVQNTEIKRKQQEIDQQKEMITTQQAHIDEQRTKLTTLLSNIDDQQKILSEKIEQLSVQELRLDSQKVSIKLKEDQIVLHNKTLQEQVDAIDEQKAKIKEQKLVLSEQGVLIEFQKNIMFVIGLFLFLVVGLAFFIYRGYRLKKKKNDEIMRQNELINSQKEEILVQNEELVQQQEELSAQRDQLEQFNKDLGKTNKKIEKSYKNSQIISEFGQKITSMLDLDQISEMIFKYLDSLMDVYAFGIGEYNHTFQRIEYKVFYEEGKPIPFVVRNLDNDKSLTTWCFKNQELVFINDMATELSNYITGEPDFATSDKPESLIHIPLTAQGKRLGVFAINGKQRNAYSKQDLVNLKTLASYTAIALDNTHAYRMLSVQNEEIKASIRYAKTIQDASLPLKETISTAFENFIFFKPRDIVSGDFYWFSNEPSKSKENPDRFLLAVVDCTGHGVPGAFMSMIGTRLLNEAVKEHQLYHPKDILEFVDEGVHRELQQEITGNDDGMDAALCLFEKCADGTVKVSYSGAKRPFVYYSAKEKQMINIKGSVKGIGSFLYENQQFVQHEFVLYPGDEVFLYTDGYADQANPDRRTLGTRNLLQLLEDNIDKTLPQKERMLGEVLAAHQQDTQQRDDITLIGLKI